MRTLLATPTPREIPSPAKYRSVTERLSDRCDTLESVASVTAGNLEWCHREILDLKQAVSALTASRTFWQRLRQLVTGA